MSGEATRTKAPIASTTAGDTTIVAGVPGQYMIVDRFFVAASPATNLTCKSGTQAITGALPIASAGNGVADEANDSNGLLSTNEGQSLVLNSSAAVTVGGYLSIHWVKSAI